MRRRRRDSRGFRAVAAAVSASRCEDRRNTVTQWLCPQEIELDLEVPDKWEALRSVSAMVARSQPVSAARRTFWAILRHRDRPQGAALDPGWGRARTPSKEYAMRPLSWIPLFAACACVAACGESRLDCGADAVTGTLSSMVRDRVLRVAADAYPPTFDATKRAALTKATRVTPIDMKLLEWDTVRGRLECAARLVVDAPGPEVETNLRRETELRYRVTRDSDELFLVEVAYADLMAVFPPTRGAATGAGAKP